MDRNRNATQGSTSRRARHAGVALTVLFGMATAVPVVAQISKTSQTELQIQPATDHETFGWSVAISGNTMVVGAQGADGVLGSQVPTGLQFDTGAAYIYERSSGNTWVRTAKLIANDGSGLTAPFPDGFGKANEFGTSVAISGDTVAVGAPGHTHKGFTANSGAVYVFQKVNGVWIQQAELLSPTPSPSGTFGLDQTVAISGNTIVVGDVGNVVNGFTPGVDVFTRTAGVWKNTATLQVPDDFSFLVASVAIDGNTVVAGSSNSAAWGLPGAGVAYVFVRKDGQWLNQAVLRAGDPFSSGQFGFSVSIQGSVVAVGAITQPGTTWSSGAAYVFEGEDGLWTQKAKLTGIDSTDSDQFGNSVSVDGDTVLVGAMLHSTGALSNNGAAYAFGMSSGRWQQLAEISASDAVSGGSFGQSVANQNGTLVIGAPGQHPSDEGYSAGELYVYQLRN